METIWTVLALALSLAATILAAVLKRRGRREEKTDADQDAREQRIAWLRSQMADALMASDPDLYCALDVELQDLLAQRNSQ